MASEDLLRAMAGIAEARGLNDGEVLSVFITAFRTFVGISVKIYGSDIVADMLSSCRHVSETEYYKMQTDVLEDKLRDEDVGA